MPITFVQTANNSHVGSATTLSVPISATGSGNLLVVTIECYSGSPITGIMDNAGNTYIQVPGVYVVGPSVNETVDIWYCSGSLGGATSVTISFTSAFVKAASVFYEYTDPGHIFSVDAGSNGVNTVPSVTTTNSGDVLIACATTDGGVSSVNPPWTHFVAPLAGTGAADYIPGASGTFPTEFNIVPGNFVIGIAAISPFLILTLTLTDSISSSDSTIKEDDKIVTDSITSSDLLSVGRAQNVSDSMTVTDSFSLQSSFIAPNPIPTVETLTNQLIPAEVKTFWEFK